MTWGISSQYSVLFYSFGSRQAYAFGKAYSQAGRLRMSLVNAQYYTDTDAHWNLLKRLALDVHYRAETVGSYLSHIEYHNNQEQMVLLIRSRIS